MIEFDTRINNSVFWHATQFLEPIVKLFTILSPQSSKQSIRILDMMTPRGFTGVTQTLASNPQILLQFGLYPKNPFSKNTQCLKLF
jgi:hypothetical protein